MESKINSLARFLPEDQTGISVRRNAKNGFTVVELDYYADPQKRSAAWKDAARQGMPARQWAVEYERAWDVAAGRPVYDGDFVHAQHVLTWARSADPSYPILRGWDFGGNQSCAIVQVQGTRVIVLDELPNAGTNTRRFAPEVIRHCASQYGDNYKYIDVVDPSAAWEGKTAEGHACTEVMREFGLEPIPAPTNDPEKRILAVQKLLMSSTRDRVATLAINPHCTMLIKGFEFGYHYPERVTQNRKADRPVKNLYSHIHDALQYVALRLDAYGQRNKDEDMEYEESLVRYRFGS